MNDKTYEFDAVIQKVPDQERPEETGAQSAFSPKAKIMNGAYIIVPFDIKSEFGKGRLSVHATFDNVPYNGSVVNMGVKNPDGSICYIIGIRKDIRAKIGKQAGDSVRVTIKPLL